MKDKKSFKRHVCCFNSHSILSRLNEILFFIFLFNSFCFDSFSGKYWKRNVPTGGSVVYYLSFLSF